MAVDIIITLTTVGTDQGTLFNLYSDLDGFDTPYEIDVSLASLQAGYTTSAPNNAGIIRVCGKGVKCINCIDITPIYTTTTSTSLPPVECGATAASGGVGVTSFSIPLESVGGVLIIDFQAFGVTDKLEILHNGIKVATSGMTVPNSGPFDNIYGDPLVPTTSQALSVDQFIGTAKGTPPKRETDFTTDTGLVVTSNKQQLIWFLYNTDDVDIDPNAVVRVTGPSGTAWNFTRICYEEATTTTTTTSTTTIAPTTTTTTTVSGLLSGLISNTSEIAVNCALSPTNVVYLEREGIHLKALDIVYQDAGGTTPFVGNGDYYLIEDLDANEQVSLRITSSGAVLDPVTICTPPKIYYKTGSYNCNPGRVGTEACTGLDNAEVWVYTYGTDLEAGKYYHNIPDDKMYLVLVASPYTEAQWITAGSPSAFQVTWTAVDGGVDCTCPIP